MAYVMERHAGVCRGARSIFFVRFATFLMWMWANPAAHEVDGDLRYAGLAPG